jgi:DNA polymerase III alpha subunit
VKQKQSIIREIGVEFAASARCRGHQEEKIKEVWELVTGFNGYAFCKAHSTAYGVEAYQAAWLKRYYPAEFMAGVLTNGKGFYHPLVYVLECHRLGIEIMSPSVNQPGPHVRGCEWKYSRARHPNERADTAPRRSDLFRTAARPLQFAYGFSSPARA